MSLLRFVIIIKGRFLSELVTKMSIFPWFTLQQECVWCFRWWPQHLMLKRHVFLTVNVSRLWSVSKERRGHPRRSRVGVAARWGNPGQEGRNQGGRANERVSGETLLLPFCLLFFSSSSCPPVYLVFCLSHPLSLRLQLWQLPSGAACVPACDCVIIAQQPIVCFLGFPFNF